MAFVLASTLFICAVATTQDQERSQSKDTSRISHVNQADERPSKADLAAKPQEEENARAKIEKSVFSRVSKSSFDLGSLGCPPDMKCQDRPLKRF